MSQSQASGVAKVHFMKRLNESGALKWIMVAHITIAALGVVAYWLNQTLEFVKTERYVSTNSTLLHLLLILSPSVYMANFRKAYLDEYIVTDPDIDSKLNKQYPEIYLLFMLMYLPVFLHVMCGLILSFNR